MTHWCGKLISACKPSRERYRAMRLEVADLHVHYGRIHALRGVSLAVGNSEIVAVLGANGAGKSSLLGQSWGLRRSARAESRSTVSMSRIGRRTAGCAMV